MHKFVFGTKVTPVQITLSKYLSLHVPTQNSSDTYLPINLKVPITAFRQVVSVLSGKYQTPISALFKVLVKGLATIANVANVGICSVFQILPQYGCIYIRKHT